MNDTPRYRLLFVMDPYPSLNLETETSLLLIEELIARGHAVDWVELADISLQGDRLYLVTRRVQQLSPFTLGPPIDSDGSDIDALLIRKDPPFDGSYLHLTQLLDHLPARVLQINPARALRAFNEKLVAMRFARFMPPTLVSQSAGQLRAFVTEHGDAVIKPLDDCSGRGIHFVNANDPLDALLAELLRDANGRPRYLQAQAFLPAIAEGDKRVYLLDGEVAGIVNRIPRAGSQLGNIHQGASVHAAGLSANERDCIDALRPFLRAEELLLVGADFIGGKLTELNITSPSALRQINAVSGERVERRLVDAIVARIAVRQQPLPTARRPLRRADCLSRPLCCRPRRSRAGLTILDRRNRLRCC